VLIDRAEALVAGKIPPPSERRFANGSGARRSHARGSASPPFTMLG
jgi:hypothetical protein